MNDLFLIAHKVHNAPAFDIATRIHCPECSAMGCSECDDLGYWWIIPTSGHRAYPWDSIDLLNVSKTWINELAAMPPTLPDHYLTRETPQQSLSDILGIGRPSPTATKIHRRF